MSKALETVFAEMSIKDMASKGLEKIEKFSNKTAAALSKAEKAAGAASRQFTDIGKSFSESKVGRAASGINQRAQGMAGAAAAGQMFHQALSQIHVVGPYLAAAMTAMHAVAQQYEAGVEQMKSDQLNSANFSRAFSVTTAKRIIDLKGFYRKKDITMAATGLRDVGVSEKSIGEHGSTLEKFARAQGHESMGAAVQALMSGQIKQGAGLTDQQIQVMKQALAQMGQSGASADMMFRYVMKMMKGSEAQLDKHATAFSANADYVRRAADNQTKREDFIAEGATTKGASGIYKSSFAVGRGEREAQRMLARGGQVVVDEIKEFAANPKEYAANMAKQAVSFGLWGGKKNGKKEFGGPVRRGESYIVGEKRPEVFVPGQSGTIIPRVPSASNSATASPPITLNIYTSDNAQSIAQAVRQELSTLFKTSLRLNMGLRMVG